MNEMMDIWRAEKIILLFLLKGVCCRDFSVTLPEKIEALGGSCVIIKCTFEIKEEFDQHLNEKNATGVWLKDGTDKVTHQVFNSRDLKPNHFNGNITGKLHEKDCTTIFYNVSSKHNGTYYFRIMSGDLRYTYKQNFSTINVIESPPKPRVQLYVEQKEVQGQEEVLEGSSVSLRCSAETLCSSPPPTLTWSSTPRIPLSESSRLQELISDLNFTATHREDRVTFTCTITYQLQDKNKTEQDSITLHVQCLNHFSLLIGVVVVALVVMLLSAITCICVRKGNGKLSQTTQEGTKRSDQSTSEVAPHENQDDPVYVMMSSAEAAANQDSVIYSPIVFTKSESQEFGGLALLDYAVMQDCSEGLLKTESSIGEFSRAREAQVIVSANVQKKKTEEEMFEDSSQIYAKVKRRNP